MAAERALDVLEYLAQSEDGRPLVIDFASRRRTIAEARAINGRLLVVKQSLALLRNEQELLNLCRSQG
jgi:hypothetical protein